MRKLTGGACSAGLLLMLLVCIGSLHAAGTDHFVPASVSTVTNSYGGGIRPGDTITLASGRRGWIKFEGLIGTAASRITIRNDPNGSGPTVIDRDGPVGAVGGFFLECRDCVYVNLDGSTKWKGAPSGRTYGIKVTTSGPSASIFVMFDGVSRFCDIRNIEVDGRWPTPGYFGIGISVNDHWVNQVDHPTLWREGFLIERNYVHNVDGEGMYIGPNWIDPDGKAPFRLRDIEIRDNIVTDTGLNGIELKSAIAGTNRIHHNIIKRAGTGTHNYASQHSGLSVYDGTAFVYNNWVEHSGEAGIWHYLHEMPASEGTKSITIYNNVVIDSGKTGPQMGHGIVSGHSSISPETFVTIYNNTVIRSEGAGIYVSDSPNAGGTIRDNLILDSSWWTPIFSSSNVSKVNNRVGTVAQQLFANAANLDFRLTAGSPARNAGSAQGFPSFDFADVPRPQEGVSDQGAFEFVSGAVDSTPPVISAVSAGAITASGATITWTTNEASDSQVQYGATTAYGSSSSLNTAKVTAHSVALTGLAAGATYHYRVLSRDAAGNLATSGDATFASLQSTYTLSINNSGTGSGTVVKNPNATAYASGTVVTLTATPASGSAFTAWSGAVTGPTNPITVTMNANKAVTATFTKINQAPQIVSSAWADPSAITLPSTTTVNVLASDPDGDALTYTWSKVSGPGTASFSPNATTASKTSTVSFSEAGTYTAAVTVSDGKGGTATSSVVVNAIAATAIAINSGGAAAGAYSADTGFAGGKTYSTSSSVTTAGVNKPAPQSVYRTERYGNFTYTIGNLTAAESYTVRLHFAEIYWSAAGKRVFNIAINGQQVLTNLDIFAVAGGKFKAIVREFPAAADAAGKITIAYSTIKDNAKSSGIEVLSTATANIAAAALPEEASLAEDVTPGVIDLGSVKVNERFKIKLDVPNDETKLRWTAVDRKALPRGVKASGGYLGGRTKVARSFTFQLQIKSKEESIINTYLLTIEP